MVSPRTWFVQPIEKTAYKAKARLLATDADRLVERDRILDREIGVHGVGPRVVQLHDVGVVRHSPVAINRPQCRDLLPPDVEDARAERTAEPLVE